MWPNKMHCPAVNKLSLHLAQGFRERMPDGIKNASLERLLGHLPQLRIEELQEFIEAFVDLQWLHEIACEEDDVDLKQKVLFSRQLGLSAAEVDEKGGYWRGQVKDAEYDLDQAEKDIFRIAVQLAESAKSMSEPFIKEYLAQNASGEASGEEVYESAIFAFLKHKEWDLNSPLVKRYSEKQRTQFELIAVVNQTRERLKRWLIPMGWPELWSKCSEEIRALLFAELIAYRKVKRLPIERTLKLGEYDKETGQHGTIPAAYRSFCNF